MKRDVQGISSKKPELQNNCSLGMEQEGTYFAGKKIYQRLVLRWKTSRNVRRFHINMLNVRFALILPIQGRIQTDATDANASVSPT